ncbi:hypothetical protein [Mucilaginibacter celer]|uniref:Uncharacterized protein n=1 Tax=Mucilaginibacter celer TaxID=2305508 RepID=A0A494VT29_9SPHI|nr:hypothetical protein [Mucilaginibacter celer]AYL97569.1 hypothetical protein HYN43_020740 [Mucilaginibacter celer]
METPVQTSQRTININKPGYILFSLISIVFLFRHDISQATVFAGLALVFDPFNPQMPFQKRPLFQKVWLIAHLTIVIALFTIMVTSSK